MRTFSSAFGLINLKESDNLEDLLVDGRIILKWICNNRIR
jgi:hypothetical protein